MPDDDAIKRLEARLTRVEAALAQSGGRPQPVVDPAAFAGAFRWPPNPVVDPTPWPHPVVDPVPWPHPIVDPVPWPRPIVDPATFATMAAQSRAAATTSFGRVGPIGDPPPIDVSRFSIAQLEATLHSINAEKARLTSLEALVTKQLDKLKAEQG